MWISKKEYNELLSLKWKYNWLMVDRDEINQSARKATDFFCEQKEKSIAILKEALLDRSKYIKQLKCEIENLSKLNGKLSCELLNNKAELSEAMNYCKEELSCKCNKRRVASEQDLYIFKNPSEVDIAGEFKDGKHNVIYKIKK